MVQRLYWRAILFLPAQLLAMQGIASANDCFFTLNCCGFPFWLRSMGNKTGCNSASELQPAEGVRKLKCPFEVAGRQNSIGKRDETDAGPKTFRLFVQMPDEIMSFWARPPK
jgi:hypothetical protein